MKSVIILVIFGLLLAITLLYFPAGDSEKFINTEKSVKESITFQGVMDKIVGFGGSLTPSHPYWGLLILLSIFYVVGIPLLKRVNNKLYKLWRVR